MEGSTAVKYWCEVDEGVNFHIDEFRRNVRDILNDPRGWRKYGFEFTECAPNTSGALKIRLASGEYVDNKCNLPGFSCYFPSAHQVYINNDNWNGRSKSKLSIDRYRTYVINHEVGHGLGFNHPNEVQPSKLGCSVNGRPASVMMQMTRGPDFISPCIENEWPLDPAEYDEMQNRTLATPINIVGGNTPRGRILLIILIIIVILMAIIIVRGPNAHPEPAYSAQYRYTN